MGAILGGGGDPFTSKAKLMYCLRYKAVLGIYNFELASKSSPESCLSNRAVSTFAGLERAKHAEHM
jgi:hypothetical protein